MRGFIYNGTSLDLSNYSPDEEAKFTSFEAAQTELAAESADKSNTSKFIGGDGKPVYINFIFKDGNRLPYGHSLVMPECSDEGRNEFTAGLIDAIRGSLDEGERSEIRGEDMRNFISKITLLNGYEKQGAEISKKAAGNLFLGKAKNNVSSSTLCTDIIFNPTYCLVDEDGEEVESECAYGVNISKMGDCAVRKFNEFRDSVVEYFNSKESFIAKGKSAVYAFDPKEGEIDILDLLDGIVLQHGTAEPKQNAHASKHYTVNVKNSSESK